jgi:predicted HTH transcriptional regulator
MPKALLTHLNLLEGTRPTFGAMLLFGADPQQFHRPAETKCVHCHGTEYRRPFGSQQIYGGDLFTQADQARDFVLSKINRKVGARADGSAAPADYELPPDAVAEAIINALAHRDYHSTGSVEVRLFADRLEIWNPGALPGNLTTEDLRQDHPSVPNNPLIADPLYLARYMEKAGSGTQAMIRLCREAGLPEPDFDQRSGFFVTTLWRHWLTEEELGRHNLNDRQRQAIDFLRTRGRITNAEYQELTGAIPKTATRDLTDLREKGLLVQIGTSGRGVHYVLQKRKQDINGTNET